MNRHDISTGGMKVPFIATGAAIVGSGAAALNAAVHLKRFGVEDLVVITEKLGAGTSANSGSDKQTYYRLNPTDPSESVLAMAEDLFRGGCMHGDIALVEAALSLQEFYHLVEIGVPFPHNRYGEYVGYRTDHDIRSRAISAGPRTSILMYEKLLGEAALLSIPILNNTEIIQILTVNRQGPACIGLLAIDREAVEAEHFGLVLIKANYVVFGTGGPGALYEDSVYPTSQIGSLGIALQAGAIAQNLTESQFGIASRDYRWNLSGSYQQVLPRYFSTAPDGSDEREFLNNQFPSAERLLRAQFLKGYEWPFDVRTIADYGSSTIDLLVYHETSVLNRRVFLDFRTNPSAINPFSLSELPLLARDYLEKSDALGDTPVQRLQALNAPACDLFLEKGVDLRREPLEIAVCHQHCNGGLAGSIWWESNVKNFFPVGECNGSHGVYRPGGSALNAGQVGSLRAAQCIAHRSATENPLSAGQFLSHATPHLEAALTYFKSLTEKAPPPADERKIIQQRMSNTLGIVRNSLAIDTALAENSKMISKHQAAGIAGRTQLLTHLKNGDLLITERAFLHSTKTLLAALQSGRGGYLLGTAQEMMSTNAGAAGEASSRSPEGQLTDTIIQVFHDETGTVHTRPVKVRPIPERSDWFEQVWREYRSGDYFKH